MERGRVENYLSVVISWAKEECGRKEPKMKSEYCLVLSCYATKSKIKMSRDRPS